MLHHIAAAGLIAVGVVLAGPPLLHSRTRCEVACARPHVSTPGDGEAIEYDVARIVARAAVPNEGGAALSNEERLKLLLLLSLRPDGGSTGRH